MKAINRDMTIAKDIHNYIAQKSYSDESFQYAKDQSLDSYFDCLNCVDVYQFSDGSLLIVDEHGRIGDYR